MTVQPVVLHSSGVKLSGIRPSKNLYHPTEHFTNLFTMTFPSMCFLSTGIVMPESAILTPTKPKKTSRKRSTSSTRKPSQKAKSSSSKPKPSKSKAKLKVKPNFPPARQQRKSRSRSSPVLPPVPRLYPEDDSSAVKGQTTRRVTRSASASKKKGTKKSSGELTASLKMPKEQARSRKRKPSTSPSNTKNNSSSTQKEKTKTTLSVSRKSASKKRKKSPNNHPKNTPARQRKTPPKVKSTNPPPPRPRPRPRPRPLPPPRRKRKTIVRKEKEEKEQEDLEGSEDEEMPNAVEAKIKIVVETDDICSICRLPEGQFDDNIVVFCSACEVCVHPLCVGLNDIPEDDWYCARCTSKSSKVVKCVLCPNEQDQSFTNVLGGGFVHVSCSCWLTGPKYADPRYRKDVIGVDLVDKNHFKYTCSICKIKGGAVLECGFKTCYKYHHVPCLVRGGGCLELRSGKGDDVFYHNFCAIHNNEKDRKSTPDNNSSPRKRKELEKKLEHALNKVSQTPSGRRRRKRNRSPDDFRTPSTNRRSPSTRPHPRSAPNLTRKPSVQTRSVEKRKRTLAVARKSATPNPPRMEKCVSDPRILHQAANSSSSSLVPSTQPRSKHRRRRRLDEGNEDQKMAFEGPTICCTKLDAKQQDKVNMFCDMFGGSVVKEWIPEITHVITRASRQLNFHFTARTMKYFKGIVTGKWILSFDWISDCISRHKLLPPEPYEVRSDPDGIGGPQKARECLRNNKPSIFTDLKVILHGSWSSLDVKEDIKWLLVRSGAEIKDVNCEGVIPRREEWVLLYDQKVQLRPSIQVSQWCLEQGVNMAPFKWILDCLSNFDRVDFPNRR